MKKSILKNLFIKKKNYSGFCRFFFVSSDWTLQPEKLVNGFFRTDAIKQERSIFHLLLKAKQNYFRRCFLIIIFHPKMRVIKCTKPYIFVTIYDYFNLLNWINLFPSFLQNTTSAPSLILDSGVHLKYFLTLLLKQCFLLNYEQW